MGRSLNYPFRFPELPAGDHLAGSFVVPGLAPVADLPVGNDLVCHEAGSAVTGSFPGRLAPAPCSL